MPASYATRMRHRNLSRGFFMWLAANVLIIGGIYLYQSRSTVGEGITRSFAEDGYRFQKLCHYSSGMAGGWKGINIGPKFTDIHDAETYKCPSDFQSASDAAAAENGVK